MSAPLDWSHVKSKVAAQFVSNLDHEAGGGDVEIIDEKLDWQAESKIDDDGQWIRREKVQCWPKETLQVLFYEAKVPISNRYSTVYKCSHTIKYKRHY